VDIDTAVTYPEIPAVVNVDGVRYFVQYRQGREELWRTDGTDDGTIQVTGVQTAREPVELNGRLGFIGTGDVFVTDGSASGTVGLLPVDVQTFLANRSILPMHLTSAEGTAYVVVPSERSLNSFGKLYRTDGTTRGASMVGGDYAIDIGSDELGFPPRPFKRVVLEETLYFIGTSAGRQFVFRATKTGDAVPLHTVDASSSLELVGDRVMFESDGALYQADQSGSITAVTDAVGMAHQPGDPLPFQVGNVRFFVTGAGTSSAQLWRTSGSSGRTLLVGAERSIGSVTESASFGNSAVFLTASGELWKSDGTAGGTAPLVQFDVPNSNWAPKRLTVAGGRLFLVAPSKDHGLELWATDGTTRGTVLYDMNRGPTASLISGLTSDGDRVYFTAATKEFAWGLWQIGDTPISRPPVASAGGPYTVAEGGSLTLDGSASSDPDGDTLTFSWDINGDGGFGDAVTATPKLNWKQLITAGVTDGPAQFQVRVRVSDGVATSTSQPVTLNVIDAPPLLTLTGPPTTSAGVGYLVELSASDAGDDRVARWTIDWGDGAVEGWSRVAKTAFHAYAKGGTYAIRAYATSDDGKFVTDELSVHVSDFVPHFLADVNPGTEGSSPRELISAGGIGYFVADNAFYGRELWRTDGTPQGTWLLKDISPGPAGSYPDALTPVGNSLYFRAEDGTHGQELWKTDGTPAGTYVVRDAVGSAFAGNIVRFGRGVLFGTALNGSLMRSDGTGAGTGPVPIDDASGALSIFDAPTVSGNHAFFASGDVSQNDKDALWTYDGRSARMVKGGFENAPRILGGDDKGSVYFQTTTTDLWRSDGTTAGTVRIPLVYASGSLYRPENLQVVNGRVFFTAILVDRFIGLNYVTRTGRELWALDSAGNVTGMVRDINPGASDSNPKDVFSFGGSIYFSADAGGGTGRRLWRTDGTESGTALAIDLGPSDQSDFTRFGDDLLFTASAANGLGLYRMTAGGAVSLIKLLAGPNPQDPPTAWGFTLHGAFVYFVGPDGEIWQSDGSASGTRPLTQLAPGSDPAPVHQATGMGDFLWFTAPTGVTGEEVWSIPLRDAIAPPAPGLISGTVFADKSSDGIRDNGEVGASGFRVFIDRNNDGDWDGGEWQTRTDSRGYYSFAGVPAGAYWVRVTPVEQWRFTTNERFRVAVPSDGAIVRYFGVTRNLLVTGNVFMDANRSGVRDSAESGLSAWRVFVDADGDGVLDDDEYSVLTDADGNYAIGVLAGGTYQVRVVGSINYRSTAPPSGYHVVAAMPGQTVAGIDFGQKRIV
jgi:ELWxxDGT repeat protein